MRHYRGNVCSIQHAFENKNCPDKEPFSRREIRQILKPTPESALPMT